MKKILIVDDEAPIREMIRFSLELANFTVFEAETGQEGIDILLNEPIDFILLDWMLPDQPGTDVIKTLRADPKTQHIPIIMLTALAEEENVVKGLQVGADDYVVKPFSPMQLIARIQAVLRRTNPKLHNTISLGGVKIDTAKRQVFLNNKLIKLTGNEYKLLLWFINNPEQIFTRQQLLTNVWPDTVVIDRTIDVYIRRLRKLYKSKGLPDPFKTERGIGYLYSIKAPNDH